jgi:hypothetical protein
LGGFFIDSQGEIDDSEAQWLRAKIQCDGKLGKIDKALLAQPRLRDTKKWLRDTNTVG